MYERVTVKRLLAGLVDYIIAYVVAVLLVIVFDVKGIIQWEVIMKTVSGVVFFVLVPFMRNGQSIGKKVMEIKVIDESGNNPSLKQHFIRSIQNWNTYSLFVTLFIINSPMYSATLITLQGIVVVLTLTTIAMVIIKYDGRGIHDLITKTIVVKLDEGSIKQRTQKTNWSDFGKESEKTEYIDD